MKRKLSGLFFLALLFAVSCTKENIPSEDDKPFSKDRFLAMSLREQFVAMTQWGSGISRIDINNIELQRVSTGVVRNFSGFSFDYCPVIDIFELAEQSTDTYSIGLRKGGPAGQVLDVAVTLKEGSDHWAEVNGLRYNVQLNSYTTGDDRDMVEYTFTPTGAVSGTSQDYQNLIAALNNSNNGDAVRPDLYLPDLRVLSLGSIKLTVALPACTNVAPQGGLTYVECGKYLYESAGGAKILINRISKQSLVITLGYNAYPNFSFQLWGDASETTPDTNPDNLAPASHENLNGKHIKDRLGKNRTVIFPDGTKMTYESTAPWYMGGVTRISIYDGKNVHHFNMTCFGLEYSSASSTNTGEQDDLQADGETSTFELTETGLIFYNIYNEDTAGNKVYERIDLGSLFRNNPNQVNDLYDDKRLGHT